MRSSRKIYLGAGMAVVLVVAALAMKGGGTPVETVQVRRGDIARTVVETGYVQPSASHELYAGQTARVIEAPVETGQMVVRGQTLVVMESPDLAAQIISTRGQLSQAEAAAGASRAAVQRTGLELSSAEENYSRTEELYRLGAVSRVEYEKALLQVETLRQGLEEQNALLKSSLARVDSLEQTLRQLYAREKELLVTSPAGGLVMSLPVKSGQVLNPGSLLATVADLESMEVKADMLSDDLAGVREGQKVIITAPVLGGRIIAGRVKQIYPRAEEKVSALGVVQRRVPVIVGLDETANLKPGFEVKVSVETSARHNVLQIPLESVVTRADGRREVMVVVNNIVARRPVDTGISNRSDIEITGGLEVGDIIVRDGSLGLPEKTRVKPQNK